MSAPLLTAEYFSDLDTGLAWSLATLLLSLDRVRTFIGDLGLDPAVVDAVQPSLREAVLDQRRSDVQDDDDPVAPEHARRYGRLLEKTREATGPGAVDELKAFAERVQALENRDGWRTWWPSLIRRLARNWTPDALSQQFGIPLAKAERVKEIAVRWTATDDENDARVDRADAEPLAGWDAGVYAHYRREGEMLSPLDGLRSHLHQRTFGQAWDQILETLDADEMDRLAEWGRIETLLNTRTSPVYAELPPSARRRPQ